MEGAASPTFGAALYTGQGSVAAGHGYRDAIDLAVAAEESGFDVFWVSEHHGWDDGYLPSPLVVLAAVAAVTTRIALGVGLALAHLSLVHPCRQRGRGARRTGRTPWRSFRLTVAVRWDVDRRHRNVASRLATLVPDVR